MNRSTTRILDANANRAREALRVMEDAARFLLDDRNLSAALKTLRHDLTRVTMVLTHRLRGMEIHRDTPRDVGTTTTTLLESSRRSARDVVIAAGKRLGEAMRCLEEYSKPWGGDVAAMFKSIRYRGYELEKRLHERFGSPHARQWRLCVIVTESLCKHHDWFDVCRAAIEAGADCLQLREKELLDRRLLERVLKLTSLRGKNGSRFSIIVNDRADIAALALADGVHLGAEDLPAGLARRLVGSDSVIGVSTHNLREARRAILHGADYCGVGTIFPTTTKRRKPSGLAYLRQYLKTFPRQPHLAIGGITPDTVARVVDAGARGIAVSSVVCGAKKPGTVVRKLLRAIPKP